MLEDWLKTVISIEKKIARCADASDGLAAIYNSILEFHDLYREIFRQSSLSTVTLSYSERHEKLRGQISDFIGRVLSRFGGKQDEFTLDFLAESFLTGSTEKWSFEDLSPIVNKIIY